jgi:hypothetical protein
MDEYKKCGMCKTRTHISEFKIKKGITLKTCNRCLEIQKEQNTKCKHGKQPSKCVECDGVGVCEHKKERRHCIECRGSAICEHKKHRQTCIECGGSAICEHKKHRSHCIECGGSSICEHKKDRKSCRECTDPIHVIIQQWIHCQKYHDIKSNRYNSEEFITYDFCKNLIEESHHLCCYCSVPLQIKIRKNDLMTIERIDNAIGHMIGNCRIACFRCNVSKVGQRV